jgi:ABC-type lipoprotein export system ATPase subunit
MVTHREALLKYCDDVVVINKNKEQKNEETNN